MTNELTPTVRRIALGCMRLSTAPDRDDDRSVAVIHAALDAGVRLLDTANVYCRDDSEIGHNERLIARALQTWDGDATAVRVATKGGLTRPQGQWVADGRARALTAACEASLRALALDRIPLYQLHAVDPRVPLSTSVRALHALKRDGLIEAVGLCNVTVGQIEEACQITGIAAVQVELNLWNDAAILGGVVDCCVRRGIQLFAHRPLGGAERRRRVEKDPLLAQIAEAHDATPFEVALAAMASLSPLVVLIPGPTRPETAVSIARAGRLALTGADRMRLADRFPACRAAWSEPAMVDARNADAGGGEVVMIMGLPGAGKSTTAESFVVNGYCRMNRDEAGGSLRGLVPALDRVIQSGCRRIVMDNTYVSRRARGAVIQAARGHGLDVRCVWLTTSVDDAQVNAVWRLVSRYGRLPGPEELREISRNDVAAFGPAVQFRYQRELEAPDPAEGFSRIEEVPFVRQLDASFSNRAVIVWCDGVLIRSQSGRRMPRAASDAEVDVERGATLRRYRDDGWKILGMSWLPEISEQLMTEADARAVFDRMRELLDVEIEVEYCPHPAGPPICWCRKPLPGLGVAFMNRHRLDPRRCIYVGSGAQDPGFARKLGFDYREASPFFST